MAGEAEIERMVVRLIGDATKYQRMLDEAKKSTKEMQPVIAQTMDKVEEVVARKLQAIGQRMSTIGKKLSLRITAPLAAISGLATHATTQFDESLSRTIGLVGLSEEAVAGFRSEILKLAPAVGKSPQELSEALFFITSAGLRGEQALEALQVTAKAAAAGMGEVKSVADAVTSAMNAYGRETLSATRATEILTAAVRAGKADASTFAPVFGQILPTANELGISFEEVGGVLAFLTKSTGSASLAATGLRGVMTQLIRPTEAVKKEMKWLTPEFVKQQIATKGLLPTLLYLKQRLAEAGLPISKLWSDIEGLNAVLQLTGRNSKDAADTMAQVADSVGIVDDAFAAFNKTVGAMLKKRAAELKVLFIELGEFMTPVMTSLIDMGQKAINVWKALPTPIKKTVATMAALAAAVGPVLIFFGSLTSHVGNLIGPVTKLIGKLQGAGGLMGILSKLGFLLSPAGLVVAGLAAVAGGIYFLQTKTGFLNPVIDACKEGMEELGDIFRTEILPVLRDLYKELEPIVREMMPSMRDILEEMKPLLKGLAEMFKVTVITQFKLWAMELEAVAMALKAIATTIKTIKAAMPLPELPGQKQKKVDDVNRVIKGFGMVASGRGPIGLVGGAAMAGGALLDLVGAGDLEGATKSTAAAGRARRAGALGYTPPERPQDVKPKTPGVSGGVLGMFAGVGGEVLDMGKNFGSGFMRGFGASAKREAKQVFEDLWTAPGVELYADKVRRAKRIMEEFMTPQEKYNKTMAELDNLLKVLGPKFQDTYDRAAKAAKEALDEATKDRTVRVDVDINYRGAEAMRSGGVEAAAYAVAVRAQQRTLNEKAAKIAAANEKKKVEEQEAAKAMGIAQAEPEKETRVWGVDAMLDFLNRIAVATEKAGDGLEEVEEAGV